MLRSVMKVLLYFILLLLVAAQLGVDVSSLVAILSVISLALSLAVREPSPMWSAASRSSPPVPSKPGTLWSWGSIRYRFGSERHLHQASNPG